ncbi:hypothetical protein [Amycolatopsis thermophila]|uniref:Uncharacterized protein n=1 Tax=Amycolatopsis thermophila TaxID=206084 RepID=A0ABU0ERM8_9PSEU|nr:hypothetical protein [Amycolatopsis thermophila]MDQ0377938.1 hypothetical protein [Amycolatopsis thermophila]
MTALAFRRQCGLSTVGADVARHGREATARCKELGLEPRKLFDERWGEVNSYPWFVLAYATAR